MNREDLKPKKKFRPFQIRWCEPLGRKECPYAYRWIFNFGLFAIRLHKWIRSDDKRYFHNHSWGFLTFVLKGGYTDVTKDKRDVLTRFSLRYRPANHFHYVEVPQGGALTLLVTGPAFQNWGFLVNGRLKRPFKYFHKYGHPICSEQ